MSAELGTPKSRVIVVDLQRERESLFAELPARNGDPLLRETLKFNKRAAYVHRFRGEQNLLKVECQIAAASRRELNDLLLEICAATAEELAAVTPLERLSKLHLDVLADKAHNAAMLGRRTARHSEPARGLQRKFDKHETIIGDGEVSGGTIEAAVGDDGERAESKAGESESQQCRSSEGDDQQDGVAKGRTVEQAPSARKRGVESAIAPSRPGKKRSAGIAATASCEEPGAG